MHWQSIIQDLFDMAHQNSIAVTPEKIFDSFTVYLLIDLVILWLGVDRMKFELAFGSELTDSFKVDIFQHIGLYSNL